MFCFYYLNGTLIKFFNETAYLKYIIQLDLTPKAQTTEEKLDTLDFKI